MDDKTQLSAAEQRLIADYLAGKQDPQVIAQVLSLYKTNPVFRQQLTKQVSLDRLLALKLAKNGTSTSQAVMQKLNLQPISSPKHKSIFKSIKSMYAVAAGVVLCALMLTFYQPATTNIQVAIVTKVAAGSTASEPLLAGKQINQGVLSLISGYSELRLNNGVVLILEAPVELNLKSPDRVILSKGKLVARVPKNAIGFSVFTPSSEIIDLGTEFAVGVDEKGDSQVHVLEGEVKARGNKTQNYQRLTKDQGLSFSMSEKVARIKSQPHLFMRALPGQSATDPDYLHWSFDSFKKGAFAASGTLQINTSYPAYDRSLENGSQPIGLHPGVFGQAVSFNGINNWLATEFPGIGGNNPRTLAFWLKVPSDFKPHQAFGIVSWGVQKNYASWQISPNPYPQNGPLGRLRVGTYNAQIVGSTDLRDNQWHHIAVVMYGGEYSDISTHVLIYVDGKLEKTHGKSIARLNTQLTDEDSKPLSLGRNIGYQQQTEDSKEKFFRGSVDELFVFGAALDHQQINQLIKGNKIYTK